jgi:hypothetical protein
MIALTMRRSHWRVILLAFATVFVFAWADSATKKTQTQIVFSRPVFIEFYADG